MNSGTCRASFSMICRGLFASILAQRLSESPPVPNTLQNYLGFSTAQLQRLPNNFQKTGNQERLPRNSAWHFATYETTSTQQTANYQVRGWRCARRMAHRDRNVACSWYCDLRVDGNVITDVTVRKLFVTFAALPWHVPGFDQPLEISSWPRCRHQS